MPDTAFVEFAKQQGISPEAAQKLGESCVTNGQLHRLIIDYEAKLKMDAIFGNPTSMKPINAVAITHSLADPPSPPSEIFWESPAQVEGGTITWNQLFETKLSGVTGTNGQVLNFKIIISEIQNDAREFKDKVGLSIGLSHATDPLNWNAGRAEKGELPKCETPMSELGTMSSQLAQQGSCKIPGRG